MIQKLLSVCFVFDCAMGSRSSKRINRQKRHGEKDIGKDANQQTPAEDAHAYYNMNVGSKRNGHLTNSHRAARVIVRARYDHVPGEGDREALGFKKGDRMRKSETTEDEHWYYAEHLVTKERGYIPKTYVVPDDNDHTAEDWWHDCDKRGAEKLLLREGVTQGSFIVRPSSDPGTFAMSLRCPKAVKHYRIQRTNNNRVYISIQKNFKNLKKLVKFYRGTSTHLCCSLSIPYEDTPEIPSFREIEVDRNNIRIGIKLGSGAFGDVFKAKWRNRDDVAVKIVREDSSMSEGDFLEEAKVMHKIRHKRLVSILGVCTSDWPLYIITEFMENGALIDFLRRDDNKNISFNVLMDMAGQIAEGMAYLEGRKFVHRDLRAANVLVGINNMIKVADFGLARFFNKDGIYETINPDPKFPVRWTAPESMLTFMFTTKSDVFSFGILLYELFTNGKMPYAGMSLKQVREKVCQGYRMPKPRELPQPIFEKIQQCWKTNPDDRPTFAYMFSYFDDYLVSLEPNYMEVF